MKEVISTTNAPAAIGPYSQGISNSGKLLFITDHVANFKPETCDTSDGGMYYAARNLW